MKLNNKTAEIFIPNQSDLNYAIKRTTHMCIAAHQDDIEIMAYNGIMNCFHNNDKHFTGVVVTNGSGSARENDYKDYTDDEMKVVRKEEQIKASILGEYSCLILLDYPSKEVKSSSNETVVNDLAILLEKAKPDVLYTHNLADKHDTHIGVVVKTIKALRSLPLDIRPKEFYGCEVWRALDWVNDDEKVNLDVSKHPNLSASLVEVFDSQINGGKRYDAATIGRRLANATFNTSHEVDKSNALTYAMDLTPLIMDDKLDIIKFLTGYINRFKSDVESKLKKVI